MLETIATTLITPLMMAASAEDATAPAALTPDIYNWSTQNITTAEEAKEAGKSFVNGTFSQSPFGGPQVVDDWY